MARQILRVFSAPALVLSLASPLPALQQDSTGARLVIVVDSLDRAAFANVAELLQARVPGLDMSRTGDGGLRWYMRGPSSVSESTPLVLIDDVRLNVAGSATREIGTRPPLLDEIDIEDVERIEVRSGPASGASYGFGAGNGVIRIITFAPRAQRTSFRIATAVATLDENVSYPANYSRPGTDSTGAPVRRCTLRLEASGGCTPGALTSINVLESASPFETALAARAAATIASGSDRLAWRGGATLDRQEATTGALTSQRLHIRGSAAVRASEQAGLTLRGHWTRGDADLPSVNEPSLLRQGLFARADTTWSGFMEPPTSPYESTRYGFGAAGVWRARKWLDARLTSGVEQMRDENDLGYTRAGGGIFAPTDVTQHGGRGRRDLTIRLDGEARYGGRALHHATSLAVERATLKQEEHFREFIQSGDVFLERSFRLHARTGIIGAGITQRLHLGQRATLAAGLRTDRVERDDVRWDVPLSSHASLTWDTRAFTPALLGGVRFRAALGDVANVPLTPQFIFLIIPGEPERPKAEITRERELGMDAMAAHDRVGLSLTWYTKRTTNVISSFQFPTPGVTRLAVLNRGIEASLRARILETRRLSWEARAWYAHNHNEVTDVATPHLVFGGGRQVAFSGKPLGALQTFSIASIRDLDGDGVIETACVEGGGTCEVTVRSGNEYRPAFPPTSASIETSVRFGALTASALVDHRSGHSMHNATLQGRCFTQCRALYDPSSSLQEQAEASLATAGAVQNAAYTKLREVSLRFQTPATWAQALGATRLDLSLAARNVATWTDYPGLDPETTSIPWVPLAQIDNAAVPLPRRFLVRIDLRGP